jgi:hypothetical protein
MRWALPLIALGLLGCNDSTTPIPPTPQYLFFLPESDATWVKHAEQGFMAGCEQARMECRAVRYGKVDGAALAEAIVNEGDTKGAPVSIAFTEPKEIRAVTDALSLENRIAITVGADDSEAYRVGHVGPDAKRLAALVAIRSQALESPARRILYVVGSSPVDMKMLDAAAFRESNHWQKYRPRVKGLSDVTDEDFDWCDLVVPIGEDAQAKAVASDVSRIFPTEPNDQSMELLRSGRAPHVIANNYFDIGLRASRIARERAVYKTIADPVLLIHPKEVDKQSLPVYLETRFNVPPLIREKSPPARATPPPKASSTN